MFASGEKKPEAAAPFAKVEKKPIIEQPLIEEYAGDEEEEKEGFLSTFPFAKALKIIIGIIILLGVGFLFFAVFLPALFKDKNEKTTLTYWGLWEEKATMQPLLDEFHTLQPNITVDYIKQDPKQYLDRVKTRFKNGTGPDIFRYHNSWLPQMNGLLLPLSTDVISKEDFQNVFYPVIQNDVAANGAIYGVPLGIDTLAMYVNTEIFQAASADVPQDWNEFAQVARSLTNKPQDGKIRTSGAAMGTFDNINHAPDIVSLLFLQNGADLTDIAKTAKNASEALDFYISFAKGDGSTWDSTLDTSMMAFAKGNLAMYFGYSWDFFIIRAINPTLAFEMYPMPHVRGGKSMTVASYWVEGAYANTKHPKEALLFMQYLAKKETEQKLFAEASKIRLFGTPFARTDLANSLKDNKYVYPFITQAPTAVSSFFASDTHDNGLNAKANGYLGNAVRAVLGNTSSESAVDTLAKGITQIFENIR